jgi:hypothetical protein
MFSFKGKAKEHFDFTAAVNVAIGQALQGGASRKIVIERLETILASQRRTEATSYRSSMLPPIMYDPVTFKPRA